jgi:hypothetical protein
VPWFATDNVRGYSTLGLAGRSLTPPGGQPLPSGKPRQHLARVDTSPTCQLCRVPNLPHRAGDALQWVYDATCSAGLDRSVTAPLAGHARLPGRPSGRLPASC